MPVVSRLTRRGELQADRDVLRLDPAILDELESSRKGYRGEQTCALSRRRELILGDAGCPVVCSIRE